MSPAELPVILLADDDADDRQLTKEALSEVAIASDLRCVRDGEELLDYLHTRGVYHPGEGTSAPPPAIILLDLNMPRKDGHEALGDIRADPALRHIPVVVFTTSSSEEDVVTSYDLGASSFITKPVNYNGLVDAMRDFTTYWLGLVQLPGVSR